jgi:hypothetical protein
MPGLSAVVCQAEIVIAVVAALFLAIVSDSEKLHPELVKLPQQVPMLTRPDVDFPA